MEVQYPNNFYPNWQLARIEQVSSCEEHFYDGVISSMQSDEMAELLAQANDHDIPTLCKFFPHHESSRYI